MENEKIKRFERFFYFACFGGIGGLRFQRRELIIFPGRS
jgi:hypothetical protein